MRIVTLLVSLICLAFVSAKSGCDQFTTQEHCDKTENCIACCIKNDDHSISHAFVENHASQYWKYCNNGEF